MKAVALNPPQQVYQPARHRIAYAATGGGDCCKPRRYDARVVATLGELAEVGRSSSQFLYAVQAV